MIHVFVDLKRLTEPPGSAVRETDRRVHIDPVERDQFHAPLNRNAMATNVAEELCLVSSVDEQIMSGVSVGATAFDSASVMRSIDDPDSGRRNDDVIDGEGRTGNLAIVEDDREGAERPVEPSAEPSFMKRRLAEAIARRGVSIIRRPRPPSKPARRRSIRSFLVIRRSCAR